MAPSTTSTLHPIVIPPTHVPPHFTTIGTGLLHGSHARESVATLHTLFFSDCPLNKPKSWWRAQCLLYGLDAPEKRTIDELRDALGLALVTNCLKVPPALLALEQAENGKFRKLNAQVRDAMGSNNNNKPKQAPKKADPLKYSKPPQKDPLKVVKSATKVVKQVQKAVKSAAKAAKPVQKAVKSPAKPAPKKAAQSNTSVTVNVRVNVQVPKAAAPRRRK